MSKLDISRLNDRQLDDFHEEIKDLRRRIISIEKNTLDLKDREIYELTAEKIRKAFKAIEIERLRRVARSASDLLDE